MHGPGSRNKLSPSHARHYAGDTLLDAIGRAVCAADCLPRKELHESWEMAVRVKERFRGGRVVDLCCGFGLLSQVMLLVDDTLTTAVALDRKPAPNHMLVHTALVAAFPQLRNRVTFVKQRVEDVDVDADDLVVSAHACGALSDDVCATAVDAGARVCVMPCCHVWRFRDDLRAHDDPARVIDEERVERLQQLGYDVDVASIPVEVSPKNRVLRGAPHR